MQAEFENTRNLKTGKRVAMIVYPDATDHGRSESATATNAAATPANGPQPPANQRPGKVPSMNQTLNLGDISDLERRKKVRVRLRPDLDIAPHKYEGRTFYVVKDPVSLRYYRFKEHERFLLDFMDGKHTLDDAQKAFEQRFRPERLTLEDLEALHQPAADRPAWPRTNRPGRASSSSTRCKKRRQSKIADASRTSCTSRSRSSIRTSS